MYFIGVDIGGTKTSVSLGTNEPKILDKVIFKTEKPTDTIRKILSYVDQFMSKAPIVSIGISCGGPLSSSEGRIFSPPNLPFWDAVPICDMIRHHTDLPVFLENDANACALAEYFWGAGKGCRHMAFLTFGTGLGAGFILNGQLYRGACDMAGEIGHIRLAENGPIGYYKSGSFEGFCSGGGISRLAEQKIHSDPKNPIIIDFLKKCCSLEVTTKVLADYAKQGDLFSLSIFEESGRRLGQGLSLLIDILNLERIVIGSIFTRMELYLRPSMEKVIMEESLSFNRDSCAILPTALSENLGDFAALGVALNKIGEKNAKSDFKASNICKSFFGVPVLKNIHLDLYEGEVHALLGENGAGKSTLMKILAGVYTKDQGTLSFSDGIELIFSNPVDAINAGITTIHQELNMCTNLTVWENLFLAREIVDKYGNLNQKEMIEKSRIYLKQFGLENEVQTIVKKLPISKQQIIEIARAVSMSSRILIMDEPTSSLSEKETEELFEIVNDLKLTGISIIYISHRLEELEKIADRVTVLRDGEFIMSKIFKETNLDEIIMAMADRDISEKYPYIYCSVGDPVLEVDSLTCEPFFRDISFELRAGEIVGFAGLVGSGRTKIAKSIAGIYPAQSGVVKVDGERVDISSIKKSIDSNIAYISENRRDEGLVLNMTLSENVVLPNMDQFTSPYYTVKYNEADQAVSKLGEQLNIKYHTPHGKMKFLSGGNQQKIMIGKWLHRYPKVFLFDEPTRGVDINAKINIYHTMNELKQGFYGILMISSELPELLGICDRILVINRGRITAELNPKKTTQDEILTYAVMSDQGEKR